MARRTRPGVEVREATPEDVGPMLRVVAEVDGTAASPLRRRNSSTARDAETMREAFLAALGDPGRRVVVAVQDGTPCGVALLALVPASTLAPDPSVRVDPLVVSRPARRRGVGRLLLGAAATYAEEHAAATLTVAVRPGDREANRHFSRLGFAPVEVRRMASVVAVRRALALPRTDVVVPLVSALHRRRAAPPLRHERAL